MNGTISIHISMICHLLIVLWLRYVYLFEQFSKRFVMFSTISGRSKANIFSQHATFDHSFLKEHIYNGHKTFTILRFVGIVGPYLVDSIVTYYTSSELTPDTWWWFRVEIKIVTESKHKDMFSLGGTSFQGSWQIRAIPISQHPIIPIHF